MAATLLAVDVGHGHTKATARYGANNDIRRKFSYPSFALPSAETELADSCITSGLRILNVETGSARFLVGEDIEMLTRPSDERHLDEGYSLSDSYLALVRGAMSRASFSTLDILVVGLPLTTLESNGARLRERLAGNHRVPEFRDALTGGKCSEVVVKRVEVLAQPLGALISAIAAHQSLASARLLTFDLGYNTLDVITSLGVRPLPRRSGAIQGGVAAYIEEIQKSVVGAVRQKIPRLNGQYRVPANLFEHAMQSSDTRHVDTSVGRIAIDDHLSSANARLEKDVGKVLAIAGSPNDISAVILAGGGASLLQPILRDKYPEIRTIISLDDPQFAIANGYLLFGEAALRSSAHHAR